MIKKQVMKKIVKFAEQKMKDRDYNHDMGHVLRTVKLIRYIAKREKADMDVCIVSAYLHDIGQSIRFKDHHITGTKMAKQFLKKLKLDKEFIDNVAYCIYHHSTKTINEAKTKEAKALYDADMLQTIGPFGYTRILTSETVFGKVGLKEALEATKDTEKKVKTHLQTSTGKKLAKDLFKLMKQFYVRYEKWDKARI